jgi:hypothetical protein
MFVLDDFSFPLTVSGMNAAQEPLFSVNDWLACAFDWDYHSYDKFIETTVPHNQVQNTQIVCTLDSRWPGMMENEDCTNTVVEMDPTMCVGCEGVTWYFVNHPGYRYSPDAPRANVLASAAAYLNPAARLMGCPPYLSHQALKNLASLLLSDAWYVFMR